jgi:putative endonuclease
MTDTKSRKDTGNKGELIAIEYLQRHEYNILATNYTIKGGELDIIAKKDGIFVFVEVKLRYDESHGHPLDTFTYPKRRAMKRTVFLYLNSNHISPDLARIDFIAIMNKKDGTGYRLWHVRGVEI